VWFICVCLAQKRIAQSLLAQKRIVVYPRLAQSLLAQKKDCGLYVSVWPTILVGLSRGLASKISSKSVGPKKDCGLSKISSKSVGPKGLWFICVCLAQKKGLWCGLYVSVWPKKGLCVCVRG